MYQVSFEDVERFFNEVRLKFSDDTDESVDDAQGIKIAPPFFFEKMTS